MSKLIIHIGLHKTATTHIQYNVLPHLKGVIYAHGNQFFRNWTEQIESGSNHMVVSYEGFSGIPWNNKWILGMKNDHSWLESFKLNVEKISLLFPDATLFILFRKHGDLLISLYKQYIQEGGILPIHEFYGNGKVICPGDLNIQKRIEILTKSFSRAYMLNFETYKQVGDDYLKNYFEKEFSIEMNSNSIQSDKRNISVSGWKLESLRGINKYYYYLPLKFRKFLRYLRWSPRDIFQHRLSPFIANDNKEINNLRENLNNKFKTDWEYFLRHEWKQ